MAFAAFVVVSVVSYLPMQLWFGDGAWFEPGHYPFPIQTSRILLYPAYFFTGVGIGVIGLRAGILARKAKWQNAGRHGSRLRLVLWPDPAPRLCPSQLDRKREFAAVVVESRYGTAFAIFSAVMAFTVLATSCGCRAPACGCSTRCSHRPTASSCSTTCSSSGCNISSTTRHGPPASRRPSCSPLRLAAAGCLRCYCERFRWWRGRFDSHGPAASWRTMRHCMANACIKNPPLALGLHVSISRIDVVRARSMLACAGFGRLSGSRDQDRGAVCAGRRHRCGGADAGAGDGKRTRRVRHHREQAGGGDHSRHPDWSRPARRTVTRC